VLAGAAVSADATPPVHEQLVALMVFVRAWVMAVVLLILGVVLIGNRIAGL
jgi:hypothetical protein